LIRRGKRARHRRNYQKHAEETAHVTGSEAGPPTSSQGDHSLTDPYADISIDPSVSDKIDWEVELAVVIGNRGANIKRERALDHVFGFTVINDVTARDIQSDWADSGSKARASTGQADRAVVVTRDEVQDPQALNLWLRVNGSVKQESNTRDMIHPVDAIIEWASKGMTLLPGP